MFGYAFDPSTPKGGGIPELEPIEIQGPFSVGPFQVVPVPIWHGKRLILGVRLGRFAYLTDCSGIPDESWPLLEGLDVVVVDALRRRPHSTHFSLEEAVAASQRIAARQTWFTHMCHDLPHAATNAQSTTERIIDVSLTPRHFAHGLPFNKAHWLHNSHRSHS